MPQIKISVPETLRYQMEINARREGVSLEQYILFALTRQTMLASEVRAIPEKEREQQYSDFMERLKRLGRGSSDELEEILQAREPVAPEPELKPETLSEIKEKIDNAKRS